MYLCYNSILKKKKNVFVSVFEYTKKALVGLKNVIIKITKP